jgi:hypothetical protein
MKHPFLWIVTGGLIGAVIALGGACSSSTSDNAFQGIDSGQNDSSVDHAAPLDQAAPQDRGVDSMKTPMEAGSDGGAPDSPNDSSNDAYDGIADAAVPFDGPLANCSPVNGACDIVSQNCPSGQECILASATDGGLTTSCSQDLPSEHLPKGSACCPSGTNPCDPELECIGDPCSADAAAPLTGRCTPHCCLGPDGGDNAPCGASVPEGYPGACNLEITDNDGNVLYAVCTYSPTCIPLGVEPCPAGSDCLVQDSAGDASCTPIIGADGGPSSGLGAGQACEYDNECAAGLGCFTVNDGGAACAWFCHVAGQATPFDAGDLTNQAGRGGCPAGEQCFGVEGFPAWLGVCSN